jgi:hypothetical protein
MKDKLQQKYPKLTSEEVTELADSKINLLMLATTLKADYIGRDYWRDKADNFLVV